MHVGNAMVVFNEKCVAPLFVASSATEQLTCKWDPPQKVGTRQIAVPCEGDPGVIFPKDGRPRVGQTVWVRPKPLVDAKGWQKTVQRRVYQKHRHKMLRSAREAKIESMLQDARWYETPD